MDSKIKVKNPPRAPRVIVSLSPEARVLLDRMAAATKQPRSSIVADLVDAGLPSLVMTLEAIEHMKAGRPKDAEIIMARFAHAATAELVQQQMDFEKELDARTIKGKRAKRRASLGRAAS